MADIQTSGLDPWLKWAGGKRSLAPRLVDEIMATSPKLYIEPFLGGGAVALALPVELPKLLADVNPHLIDCWLCMQKIPGALFAELHDVEHVYGDQQDGYLRARTEFNGMVNHPRKMWARRSALFFYLNARCFNGLWRTNAKGCFNVPFARREHPRKLTADEVAAYSEALKHSTIVADHFVRVLGAEFTRRTNAVRGQYEAMKVMMNRVALYIDPPYDGTFDGYAKGGFSANDQRVLAAVLLSFASAGAAVWATNADTPLIREAYAWAQIEEIDETHVIGSKPERRGKRSCLLIRGGSAIQ